MKEHNLYALVSYENSYIDSKFLSINRYDPIPQPKTDHNLPPLKSPSVAKSGKQFHRVSQLYKTVMKILI